MGKENNQLIFYSTPKGTVKVEVIFESEAFWLSQKRMAELFGVNVRTVNEHLKNIFKTGELAEDSDPEFPDNCNRWQKLRYAASFTQKEKMNKPITENIIEESAIALLRKPE